MLNKKRGDEPEFHAEHPMKADDITNENYRGIALALFNEQAKFTAAYLESVAENGWSDDDTDYMSTALDVTQALMSLAYDGDREGLVSFLYSKRDHDSIIRDTLADMISAGGLCDSVQSYEEMIYLHEDLNRTEEA
jgi:hypothetical protein